MTYRLLLIAVALATACSTTPTPGVCCIGAAECSRLGLTEDRRCPAGQACVELQCVLPSCATQGCTAEAPVCDVTTDVCTGCADASDCSRFGDRNVCDPQTGSCVECLVSTDCTVAVEPVCDAGACRGCRLDAECPSGACGEDGACVPEAGIVYLHPNGVDQGMCRRDLPCKRLQFGATRTSLSRGHIVMLPGLYDLGDGKELIASQDTPVELLHIHGGGSMIRTAGEVDVIDTQVSVTIRDLEIMGGTGALGINSTDQSILERLRVRDTVRGVSLNGHVLMRDVSFENTAYPVLLRGAARLVLDRGVMRNPSRGISSNTYSAVVDITNLLVFGAADLAIDLEYSAGGTVRFTTIVDSGADSGTGPRAFKCPSSGLAVQSSIIWAPGTTARSAIDGGCTLSSTIVGPTPVPGATNVNPLFVDAAGRDYRLSAASPARDMVDVGPTTDYEGDPRPQGPRYDIGADESP